MNDCYDVGVNNDIFYLISLMNNQCKVKVKTPVGDTDQFDVNQIEMQGTVTAPLKCAVQIDTLGRYCYKYSTGLYFYKNACAVPPLGMIDDICGVANCGDESIILNAIVNTKIETKKLQFNQKKCVYMHVGPDDNNCPELKTHEYEMKNVKIQTYLGDIISNLGNNSENIKSRVKIGFAAISQIKSLVKSVGFGRFDIPTGLLMRETIFGSKMLLNSEVWHSVTKSQIEEMEIIDRNLLRQILGAHSKTAIEWLYVDTGKLKFRFLIKIRRLMYLWHILNRDKSELIRKIYEAQKLSNNIGDWIRLVEADKDELEIDMNDDEIQNLSKEKFKDYVTKKAKIQQLHFLKTLKKKHTKSEFLDCTELKTAEYLKAPVFNTKQKQLLFKLRSRTLDVKSNFPGHHRDLLCRSCGIYQESQGHLLQCAPLVSRINYLEGNSSKLNENDIYKDIMKQQIIVNIYSDLLEVRENLQNHNSLSSNEGPVHLVGAA